MLPAWAEFLLADIATFQLLEAHHGLASPLGDQLRKAELLAKHLTDCRRCHGKGFRTRAVNLKPEEMAWLAQENLTPEEEIPCGWCQSTGKVWRSRAKSLDPNPTNTAWPHMFVKSSSSEPSYSPPDPPALGRNGREIRACLAELCPADRAILLNFYADFPEKTASASAQVQEVQKRFAEVMTARGRLP